MKIIIIGSSGQLGQEFARLKSGHTLVPLTHEDIEVADKDRVNTIFSEQRPDTVINLAAFNRVDECEDKPDKAFQVNALGARNVACAARAQGSAVVFVSTDYVYSGERNPRRPYLESDPAMPLNVYGVSKLAGEHMTAQGNPDHWIIRTSGLYGVATSRKGWTFPELILKKAKAGESLRVVDDQVLTPTYTRDLAGVIMAVLEHGRTGIYHLTNGGQCSWYEFARTVLEMAGVDAEIIPIPSSAFPSKAHRPGYSVLESERLKPQGLKPMRHWKEALEAYLIEKGILS